MWFELGCGQGMDARLKSGKGNYGKNLETAAV